MSDFPNELSLWEFNIGPRSRPVAVKGLSDCFVTYVKSIMGKGQKNTEHLTETTLKRPFSPVVYP